jgi:hypothetical protein
MFVLSLIAMIEEGIAQSGRSVVRILWTLAKVHNPRLCASMELCCPNSSSSLSVDEITVSFILLIPSICHGPESIVDQPLPPCGPMTGGRKMEDDGANGAR